MSLVLQIVFVAFTALAVFVCIAGIREVNRHCRSRTKVLWIIGCLFGFVGLGIDWSHPSELVLEFGVQIPVAQFFAILPNGTLADLPNATWVGKAMFPFVALFALTRDWPPTE